MKADSGGKEQTVFWDRIAGVYDFFVNVVNGKTHKALKAYLDKKNMYLSRGDLSHASFTVCIEAVNEVFR